MPLRRRGHLLVVRLTGEHFIDTIATADKRNQIMQAEPFLLHVIFDRYNRIRQIKRIMFCLPGLYEGNEHIKPIARRRVAASRALVLRPPRPLTLKMIWRLYKGLGIPAESLIKGGQQEAA
jgi:hypothetical protein